MHLYKFGDSRFIQYRTDADQFIYGHPSAKQMIQGQHTVRLTAAEGRLQLNDGISAQAAHALQRLQHQPFHTRRHIGALEEFNWIQIFRGPFTLCNLSQIRGELRVFITSLRDVRVRLHNRPPAWKIPLYCHDAVACTLRFRRGVTSRSREHRALGGAVAQLPSQRTQLLCALVVQRSAEARHRIKRPPCVILVEISDACVSDAVADAHQLLRPRTVIYRKFLTKNVVPSPVEKAQTVGEIQRVDQRPVLAALRQIGELVAERSQNVLPPARSVCVIQF